MKKPTIFISHASKDGKIATSIRDMITASSSLAPDDIRCTSAAGSQLAGNVDFDAKLKEEIQNAKLCIFLVSKYFLGSEYCKKEMIWADDTKVTCAIFMMDELPYNAITPIIGNKNCYNFDELGLDNLFELLYKQEVKVDLPVWNQLKNNVLSLIKLRIKSEYKAPRPNHRLVIQGPIAVQVGSVFKDISETGEYWNQHSWDIVFEKPFSSVPAVTVSINLLDEGTFIVNRDVKTSEGIKKTPTATIRIKVAAENITREGFTILANPWNINMLHGIGISWMAIGEA